MTYICVSDLTSISSDNGLSPGRRQAIIRTNAGILLIRPLGTNFSEFVVEILIVSFKKLRLKVSSAKRRPFCLGLNELNQNRNRDWFQHPVFGFAGFYQIESGSAKPLNHPLGRISRNKKKTDSDGQVSMEATHNLFNSLAFNFLTMTNYGKWTWMIFDIFIKFAYDTFLSVW